MDDAQLRTIWQQRQERPSASPVGEPLAILMKHTLGKRVRQLSAMAEIWDEVIPQDIREHTALEGLSRGVLTVVVDSSAHRYQLQMLLTGGLMQEIRRRYSGPLNKIRLVPGQFYAIDLETGERRYTF
jgi:predicted nucleic acid-binding Zn ribbon protein